MKARECSQLMSRMTILYQEKRTKMNPAAVTAMKDCIQGESAYRSAFDIFEEKRNIDELLDVISEYNKKLCTCLNEMEKL